MTSRAFKREHPQFASVSDNGSHFTAYLIRGYAFKNPGTKDAEHGGKFTTLKELLSADYYDCRCELCNPTKNR